MSDETCIWPLIPLASQNATPNPTACQRLMEADAAYHSLSIGGGVRAVTDENGERIEYTMANRANLLAYIRTLAPQCPTYQPTALNLSPARGNKFFF